MNEKNITQEKFSEKLLEEYGLRVDWDTHHKTSSSYLRWGDPNTCSHWVELVDIDGNHKGQNLLLYHSLRDYNRKIVELRIINAFSGFEDDLKNGDLKCLFKIKR